MREDYKNDWVEASLVKDLNYIKTGVEEYDGKKDYYSTGSVKDDSINSEGFYTYSDRPSRANRVGQIGDILQARMKNTDKAVLINNNLNNQLFSTGFFQIRTDPESLLPKYLFHYFKSFLFLNQKDTNCSGSTQSALNDKSAQKLFIPISPIPIQRAIVAKIEELFSDLNKGIADLKKAQDQLVIFRQAVLKKAFDGELTREWRKQQTALSSAVELLKQIKDERKKHYEQQILDWKKTVKNWEKNGKEGKKPAKPKILNEVASFTKNEKNKLYQLSKTWDWIKSGQIFNYVTSGSRGWAKYYSNEGGIFIRITNLNFNTLELDLSPQSIQYVKPPASAEGLRTKVIEGDFLFSITGYLGMFAIAPHLDEAYVNQHVSLARPSKLCSSKFLGYWIIAKTGGNYHLNKKSKGATKAGLGLDDIVEFPIPLCSIEEQHQIVKEIESRLSVCDNLELSIVESLEKAKALRQSILKKAFDGTLLSAEEIAACMKERDYEPASVLLEKIKAEKKKP